MPRRQDNSEDKTILMKKTTRNEILKECVLNLQACVKEHESAVESSQEARREGQDNNSIVIWVSD